MVPGLSLSLNGLYQTASRPFFEKPQAAITALPELLSNPYAQDATVCIGAAGAATVWTKLFDIAVDKGLLEKVRQKKIAQCRRLLVGLACPRQTRGAYLFEFR